MTATGDEWRDNAACKDMPTSLFFRPCRHPNVPLGEVCPSCWVAVDVTEPRWTPNAAREVCATCPVRVECLTWAVNTHQRWGIWGGAAEPVLRALQRARRAGDHDYQVGCGCEYCTLVTEHLTDEPAVPDTNTEAVTHGARSTYGRGCRCPRCRFRVTTTGELVNDASWDVNDWWIALDLPLDDDPDVLEYARNVTAAVIAGNLRDLLAGDDIEAFHVRLAPDRRLTVDVLRQIVEYRDVSTPPNYHLSPVRAARIARTLGVPVSRLVML